MDTGVPVDLLPDRHDGIRATCRPYLWVELDEQVKEAVRPYWEQLIRLDCEHDVRVRRAEYTERLRGPPRADTGGRNH